MRMHVLCVWFILSNKALPLFSFFPSREFLFFKVFLHYYFTPLRTKWDAFYIIGSCMQWEAALLMSLMIIGKFTYVHIISLIYIPWKSYITTVNYYLFKNDIASLHRGVWTLKLALCFFLTNIKDLEYYYVKWENVLCLKAVLHHVQLATWTPPCIPQTLHYKDTI